MLTIEPLKSTEFLKLMLLCLKFAGKLFAGGQYLNALKYYEKCFKYAQKRVFIRNSVTDLKLFVIAINKLVILCKEAKDDKKKSYYDNLKEGFTKIQREGKHK